MDRIQQHLQTIPIDTLAVIACAGIMLALLMPKKFGFYISLFLMGSWLNLNRFIEIPFVASAAKVTFWIPPLLLVFFSFFMPGIRNPVPKTVWPFLFCPFIGFACVIGAENNIMGFIQFFTMFVLAASAISLYRVTTTTEALLKHLMIFFMGICVPIGVALLDLIVNQIESFRLGVNRFEPFGMLSNQYVHLLATASGLAASGYVISHQKWLKIVYIGVIGACATMLIASGSRQGLIIFVISLLPFIWQIRKNPIAIAIATTACLGIGVWLFQYTKGITTNRITDFSNTSGRYDIMLEYARITSRRPVTGLMGTTGESVTSDDQTSTITHNSYVRMIYIGGALLTVPLIITDAVAFASMIYVLRRVWDTSLPPIVVRSMAALLLAILLQGLVNDMIYIAVSSWAFLHYFLACFFIGTAIQLKRAPSFAWSYSPVSRQTAWG